MLRRINVGLNEANKMLKREKYKDAYVKYQALTEEINNLQNTRRYAKAKRRTELYNQFGLLRCKWHLNALIVEDYGSQLLELNAQLLRANQKPSGKIFTILEQVRKELQIYMELTDHEKAAHYYWHAKAVLDNIYTDDATLLHIFEVSTAIEKKISRLQAALTSTRQAMTIFETQREIQGLQSVQHLQGLIRNEVKKLEGFLQVASSIPTSSTASTPSTSEADSESSHKKRKAVASQVDGANPNSLSKSAKGDPNPLQPIQDNLFCLYSTGEWRGSPPLVSTPTNTYASLFSKPTPTSPPQIVPCSPSQPFRKK